MNESNGGQLQQIAAENRNTQDSRVVYPDGRLPIPERPLGKMVTIEPVNHGYVVTVGRQRFAVEHLESLLHRLGDYLRDPMTVEGKWLSGELKW
jgi:hypothetical protein